MIDAGEVANSLISQYSSKDYGMVRETAVTIKLTVSYSISGPIMLI